MILSVVELKAYIKTDESDSALALRLQALESFICRYTNNDFISRTTYELDYPIDIKMGVINLLKWDFANRDKLGISSESISRHTVSYSGLSGSDSIGGYPTAMLGFLKPYMRARF